MQRTTILIAEDDRKTAELLRLYLEREEFWTLVAHDGRLALELVQRREPDLILLDIMLPHVDGLDICRSLRRHSSVPIIMLTARSTEDDILSGLDLGADDYITKPFSPREVVARVRAVLRRGRTPIGNGEQQLICGDLIIDLRSHQVIYNGEQLRLTPREYRLLVTFARNPGRAFSRTDLLTAAFGYDYGGMERTVDVHILNLRKKLESKPTRPRLIETVYGVGYRFDGKSVAQNG